MPGPKRREPDLLSYTDFRKYLRDYYAFRKSHDRRFSYGVFAKRAGLTARSHLKAVLDYGLRLTPETLAKYRKTLGLTGPKGEYFSILVALDQASDETERESAKAALRRWRVENTWKRVPAKGEIRDHWTHSLVKTLRKAPGFRPDPAWICPRLLGGVTPEEVAAALELLKKAGLLGSPVSKDDVLYEGKPSDAETKLYRTRLLRGANRKRNRDLGFGGSSQFILSLTRAQALELDRKLFEWLKANLPSDSEWTPGSAVCVVLGDVFAVSEPI